MLAEDHRAQSPLYRLEGCASPFAFVSGLIRDIPIGWCRGYAIESTPPNFFGDPSVNMKAVDKMSICFNNDSFVGKIAVNIFQFCQICFGG